MGWRAGKQTVRHIVFNGVSLIFSTFHFHKSINISSSEVFFILASLCRHPPPHRPFLVEIIFEKKLQQFKITAKNKKKLVTVTARGKRRTSPLAFWKRTAGNTVTMADGIAHKLLNAKWSRTVSFQLSWWHLLANGEPKQKPTTKI